MASCNSCPHVKAQPSGNQHPDPFGPVYRRLARVIALSYRIDLSQPTWRQVIGWRDGAELHGLLENWVRSELKDWETEQAPILVGRLIQRLDQALDKQGRAL